MTFRVVPLYGIEGSTATEVSWTAPAKIHPAVMMSKKAHRILF
jgi:hypothetical protein